MARAACKIIIDGGLVALGEGLRQILTDPNLNGAKIPDTDRFEMIQSLADIDLVAYSGGEVKTCLRDVMTRLEKLGVLSPEVWKVYTPNS